MAPYDDVTHAFVGPAAEVLLLLKALQDAEMPGRQDNG